MTDSEKHFHAEKFTKEYEHAEEPALPESLSGYRFISCLADSGKKKTWILEKANGQRVLCKFASGEYMDMLRTESEFFSLGKFPFVPYVFDYLETPEGAYLLREYIEGQTLSDLVEKEGPLPLDRAIPLIGQLCSHLSRLHASVPPIIYRDLKPSNVVLTSSGDCYLIDLGTVRTYNEDNTVDTVFIGTVGTAAPEQFGARQTDARTDIYALGILFYYLLTGELEIQERKLKKLPSKAAGIIRKCTAFDPNNRYSQVSLVADALQTSARKKVRRAAVAAVVICTVAALGTYLFVPKPTPAAPDTPEVPEQIVFSSPLLEQAVRETINKPEGEPVYEQDLVQVTRLYICGDTVFQSAEEHSQFEHNHTINGEQHGYGDISDISLLEKMPNLHTVVLDYQRIYDISPLRNLHLTTLSLCGNPVTDLSGLQDQKALRELYLSETGVTSLAGLENCSALLTLDCSYTAVVSLEPLSALPIHSLHLTDTPVSDFETLSSLPLAELYLSYVSSEHFAYIENITSLQNLTLTHCGITSLKELSCFNQVYLLDVTFNQITDLDGLEEFTRLQHILLANNPITDLSPLAKMGNLSHMSLATGTDVDFAFLNEMPWVQHVTVNTSQLEALYRAVPEPWFELEHY